MNESKATRYQRLKRRAETASVVAGAVLLAGVGLTPLGGWLARWTLELGRGLPAGVQSAVALVVFATMLVVLWDAVALPPVLYLELRLARRFTGQLAAPEDVFVAQAQATLAALPAVLVAASVVFASSRLAGRAWWMLAGALLAAVLAAALRAGPRLLIWLGGAGRIERPALVAHVRTLADRAGVPVAGVDVWRGRGAAAAIVAGVGRSRRVLVNTELVRDWDDGEIAVVVAHELAHHAHHDLWRTMALDAATLVCGLWVADLMLFRTGPAPGTSSSADLAALPLVALLVGAVWLAATPLRLALSRAQERRADRFALALTGGAEAFGVAIRRLGARHLAEEHPSAIARWFFHRHPPVSERLELAERYRLNRS